jgi:hypothetical protein
MFRSTQNAIAKLRKKQVLMLTPAAGIASLVGEVAGAIKGSWWSHPKGGLIFRIGEELGDSPEVLVTKVVGGKVAFVHKSLWPALLRVTTDAAWRSKATVGLSPSGRRLFEAVDHSGLIRLDRYAKEIPVAESRGLRKARSEVEKRMLVHSGSEHTEKGSHAAVLESWRRVAERLGGAERAVPLDAALAALRKAGIDV